MSLGWEETQERIKWRMRIAKKPWSLMQLVAFWLARRYSKRDLSPVLLGMRYREVVLSWLAIA